MLPVRQQAAPFFGPSLDSCHKMTKRLNLPLQVEPFKRSRHLREPNHFKEENRINRTNEQKMTKGAHCITLNFVFRCDLWWLSKYVWILFERRESGIMVEVTRTTVLVESSDLLLLTTFDIAERRRSYPF